MQFARRATARFRSGRTRRTQRARREFFDRLEDRTTPAGSFGSAFALGATAFDSANSVVADSAGDIYVTGSFNGTIDLDPGPGTTTLTSSDHADGFLAKFDPDGNLLWAGQFIDSTTNELTVDGTGSVLVTGRISGTTDFDFGPGVALLETGSWSTAFVAKYSPAGGLAWAKGLGGGTASVSGDSITVDAAGNVYSAGILSNGSADMNPGAGTFTLTNSSGNANAYVSKLDSSGNFVWARMFANDPSIAAGVWISGIGVDAAQNVYVTGIYVGRVDFDPGAGTAWKTTADVGSPYGDGYVARLTAAGSLDYFVSMGSSGGRDDGNGIAVDATGNAYITGEFSSTMVIASTSGNGSLTSAGGYDLYVAKLTPTGGLGWARRIGSSVHDLGQEITYDGSNSLYLTGYFMGAVDFDPGAGTATVDSAGETDTFALRLDTNGGFGWVSGLGGSQPEFGSDIAVNGQGVVFTVGRFSGMADFDPGPGTFDLTSSGGDDAFVSRLTQALSNQPPTAVNDSYSIDEDATLSVAGPGVLGNDSDPDGNALTAVVVAGPSHGSLSVDANGALVYTPSANFHGADTFTYRASDGTAVSSVATVTITVRSVNDAPVAPDLQVSTDEDILLNGRVTVTDADGDALTYTRTVAPANGFAGVRPDGTFVYLPSINFHGTDQFVVTVSDGTLTDTVTVTVTVNPVNDAPFVDSPTFTTLEDTSLTATIDSLEVEGDPYSFSLETAPAHGGVALQANGAFVYTPSADSYGIDTFVVRVTDSHGAWRTGTVTVKVRPVNDAPVARNDQFGVAEDQSLVISAGPLSRLRMVSEPGDFIGAGLTYDYTTADATFTAAENHDNGVTINVDPPSVGEWWVLNFAAPLAARLSPGDFPNAMRYPFQAADRPGLDVSGTGRGSNELTGEFLVYEAVWSADQSTVVSFAASFVQHSEGDEPALRGIVQYNTRIGSGAGVLGNDSDVDGDLFTAILVSNPSHGTLSLNPDGTLVYTPFANFSGTDTFTYKVNDGRLDSGVVTATITVGPVNDAPAASDDVAATSEDVSVVIAVLGNDSDPDGDAVTPVVVTSPGHGTLALNAGGTLRYTPAADFSGTDTFTYRVNDGSAVSNLATVTVTVNPVNDAPRASGDTAATTEDSSVIIGVLGNDSDPEGDALTPVVVSPPGHGTLTLNAGGTLRYTPAADFSGTDTFTYRVNDGSAVSNLATVTVVVSPVNDAPTALAATFSVAEESANGMLVGVIQGVDVDGDRLSYAIVSGNADGAFALDPTTGRITVADGGRLDFETTSSYVIVVSVVDPAGLSTQATVTINLTDVNEDAPVLIDIRPGDASNAINMKSNGKIEVAILATPGFDARSVDVDSLRFGRTGREDSASRNQRRGVSYEVKDVNGDGRSDLVVRFEIERTGFQAGDTVGFLTGRTRDGRLFEARDAVFITKSRRDDECGWGNRGSDRESGRDDARDFCRDSPPESGGRRSESRPTEQDRRSRR